MVSSEMISQAERNAGRARSGRRTKRGLQADESLWEDQSRLKRRKRPAFMDPSPRRADIRGEVLGSRWEEAMIGPPRRDIASHAVIRSVRRSARISSRVAGNA